MSSQHRDHSDIQRRVRQAWDSYQAVDRARAESSAAVTAELVAARAQGVSMYRMAKWLEVTERTIQARLEKYDRANPKP